MWFPSLDAKWSVKTVSTVNHGNMEIGLDSLSKVERMSEGIDDQQSYDIV